MTHGIQSKISVSLLVIRKRSRSKAARSGRGLLMFYKVDCGRTILPLQYKGHLAIKTTFACPHLVGGVYNVACQAPPVLVFLLRSLTGKLYFLGGLSFAHLKGAYGKVAISYSLVCEEGTSYINTTQVLL